MTSDAAITVSKAVILVGGEGTRLRPLTLTTPKQMLPIVDQTMIERVVSALAAHGVDEVILSLGYRPDAFLAAFPNNLVAGVKVFYAVEPEPLDTGGAIGFAARLAGISERFIVVNGDVLTDLDVGAVLALHHQRAAEATIALTPVDDPSAFGVVPTEEDGRVIAFIEKPPRDEAPTNFINAGTYVFEPSVIDRIAQDRRVSIEREIFPAMASDGTMYAQGSDAYWLDTGTPEKFLSANLDLLAGRRMSPPHPDAKEVSPGVWTVDSLAPPAGVAASFVGMAAVVASSASVTNSIIGAGATVDAGATVRDSVLLPGAVIASGAIVEGSIIGGGAKIHSDAKVRPLSVIGANAEVASGSELSDARVPQ